MTFSREAGLQKLARTWEVLGLALVLAVVTGAPEASAQTQTIIVNTGWDNQTSSTLPTGAPDLDAAPDLDWLVISDPLNPPNPSRPADVVPCESCPFSWADPFPDSQWISAAPNKYNGQLVPPYGLIFSYEFHFTLPPGFVNPQLSLQLRADEQNEDVE